MTLVDIAKQWDFDAWDINVYFTSIMFDKFFMSNYNEIRKHLPTNSNPKLHDNWKFFDDATKISTKLNISPYRYFQVLFYRLQDDGDWKVFPSMIASEWALNRYYSLYEFVPKDNLNNIADDLLQSLLVSKNFIANKMNVLNMNFPDDLYEFYSIKNKGCLLPVFLGWIDQGIITKSFLSISSSFYDFSLDLEKDVYYDYVNLELLDSYFTKLFTYYSEEKLREIMGDDLLITNKWRKK